MRVAGMAAAFLRRFPVMRAQFAPVPDNVGTCWLAGTGGHAVGHAVARTMLAKDHIGQDAAPEFFFQISTYSIGRIRAHSQWSDERDRAVIVHVGSDIDVGAGFPCVSFLLSQSAAHVLCWARSVRARDRRGR